MHTYDLIRKVQMGKKKKRIDYNRKFLFPQMRLLPVQASIVNPVIFVVCKIVITTANFVTGCVNAGGTTITYSYDPLSVDTSEAFNTALLVPIRATKDLIGSNVTKVNCMT
jgi:YD repeat-containing protein